MSEVGTADPAEPGLRERKRIATRRAILLAALQLVSEKGLESTTVDEISRLADVSPRTFFNYFPSKEDALAGEAPQMPSDAAVERFIAARGPLIADLGHLFDATVDDVAHDVEMIAARKEVFQRYPHITALRMEHFRHFEADLLEVVERRLTAEHPEQPEDDRSRRARLAVFVCIATMRHAWMTFAASGEPAERIVDRMHESFAELTDLLATSAPPPR
ncbi:TetR/AcrR family transcriptional regulator [Pseudolysinimonas sp.]|uniref:TetR/AcrR family transcriptional regulator n=1 Tax=Pseudolysinimonas sp. TaxID=2680009 RepID=UPI003F7D7CF1